jgi:hypothetical protein
MECWSVGVLECWSVGILRRVVFLPSSVHHRVGGALHSAWQFYRSTTPVKRGSPRHSNRRDARGCFTQDDPPPIGRRCSSTMKAVVRAGHGSAMFLA